MADYPVSQPMFTNLLVKKLVREEQENPGGKFANPVLDTLLRHSDGGYCSRRLGLRVAGYAPSDPPDAAGLWVMWLGTIIGEAIAEEAMKAIPGTIAEYAVGWDDLSASGRLDLLVDLPRMPDMPPGRHEDIWRVCVEYKTMGAFGFDKSVGLLRPKHALNGKGPAGPRSSAKIQGALNAVASDADELRIGHLSLEAVSKQLAAKLNWNDEDRILAEWSYYRAEFEPWAEAEKARMKWILGLVSNNTLPDRWAVDDQMQAVHLNPQILSKEGSPKDWQCSYCNYRGLCEYVGMGEVTLPLAGITSE